MSEHLFLQPNNWLGQFLQQSWLKRFIVMLGLSLLCVSYPSVLVLQRYQEVEQQAVQVRQLEESLQHQQRLLASLKQKQQQQLLTPQIAAKLANINRSLQQNLSAQQIRASQWRFEQSPILQLQLESSFTELLTFIYPFLSQHSMALLTLDIEKAVEKNRTLMIDGVFQLEYSQEEEK